LYDTQEKIGKKNNSKFAFPIADELQQVFSHSIRRYQTSIVCLVTQSRVLRTSYSTYTSNIGRTSTLSRKHWSIYLRNANMCQ